MSEIIFPASPLAGQSFNAPNGLQYSFDGVKWSSLGAYSKNVKDIFTLSLAESFDGSKTTFTLQSNGENVYITTPEKATILLGGVLQEPTAAYTVNTGTSEITFASAPPAGTTFSGTLDSQAADQVVEDGVITNIKVASSAAIDGTKISPNFGSQNIVTTGTIDGRNVSTDGTKLDGIESNATADQTDEEIQDIVGAMLTGNTESGITVTYQDADGTIDFAVASQTDQNFTNADHAKLDGIESNATADQTAAEIRTLVEAASDSNVFTDADHTKLNGLAVSATAVGGATGVDFNDNVKARFGTDNDLSIFHDNTDAKITNTTGNLLIEPKSGETGIKLVPEGAVELYYDNVLRLSTQSWGVSISGTVAFNDGDFTLTKTNSSTTSNTLRLRTSGNTDRFTIQHASGNTEMTNLNGNLLIRPKASQEGIKVIPDDAVELYHSGNKKLETTSTGSTTSGTSQLDGDVKFTVSGNDSARHKFIGGGTGNELELGTYSSSNTSRDIHMKIGSAGHITLPNDSQEIQLGASQDLKIYHNGTNNYLDSSNGHIYLRVNSTENAIKCTQNGNVEISYDGTKKIETTSGGAKVESSNFSTLEIRATTNDAVLKLTANDDDSTDWTIHNDYSESNDLDFRINNSRKMNLDSSGNLFITGSLDLNDDTLLRLGNSDDFTFRHDTTGTNVNIIDSGPDLQINHGAENMAIFYNDAQVELFYDNALRLTTTSGGVEVSRSGQTGNDTTFQILAADHADSDADLVLRVTNNTANSRIKFGDPEDQDAGGMFYDHEHDHFLFKVGGANKFYMTSSNIRPNLDNTDSLGSSTKRFSTLYSAALNTGDIHMSNLNSSANEVDSTQGSWTLQEGANDLFLINRLNGKKYKFNITEIN